MRPPQFSLRTLLIFVAVLAVPCWYAGEQWRFVQGRKQYIAEHPTAVLIMGKGGSAPPASWLRRLLGDESHNSITVDTDSDEEMQQVQALFPESQLYRIPWYGDSAVYPWPKADKADK